MSRDTFKPRLLRIVWRLLLAVPLALVAYGLIEVRVAEWLDRRRYPEIGQRVDIGGRSLNLYCSGSGSPTVVFESGFGQPGYTWHLVQPRIATTNRACWYDRAGNGWSDPAPGKRYSDSVVSDLHRLLTTARIPPPYVLVGHSIGGFHVRVYNARYPSEVAGLVLVDPSNEDIGAKIPDMARSNGPNLPPAVVHTVDFVVRETGLWRWFMRDQGPRPDSIAARDWNILVSQRRTRKAILGSSKEAPEIGSARVARAAGGLDSVPLVVMTRGHTFSTTDTARGNSLLRRWIELSGELAHKSSRGSQVVVPGSGHFIHYSAPGAVVDAIHKVIALSATQAHVAAR